MLGFDWKMSEKRFRTTMYNSSGFSGEKGTTIVEFALVAIVFLLLTLGLVDVGRGVWAHHSLTHAAREGARYAIVHGDRSKDPATDTIISNLVKNRIPNLSGVTVSTTWIPSNSQASRVEVTAQYTFDPIMSIFDFTVPMTATTRMAVSY